jgi:hypothetical protein
MANECSSLPPVLAPLYVTFQFFIFAIFGTNLAFLALRLLVSCPGDSSNNTPPDKINYQMNELKQMKPI